VDRCRWTGRAPRRPPSPATDTLSLPNDRGPLGRWHRAIGRPGRISFPCSLSIRQEHRGAMSAISRGARSAATTPRGTVGQRHDPGRGRRSVNSVGVWHLSQGARLLAGHRGVAVAQPWLMAGKPPACEVDASFLEEAELQPLGRLADPAEICLASGLELVSFRASVGSRSLLEGSPPSPGCPCGGPVFRSGGKRSPGRVVSRAAVCRDGLA
jgi:hypothetical protein